MLTEHLHKPGRFDPGHCQMCAREADLLDHYWHVQRQERALNDSHRWARDADRQAVRALWLAGAGILLAVIALVLD